MMKRIIIVLLCLSPVSAQAQEAAHRACKTESERNCIDLNAMQKSAIAGNAADAAALGMLYGMGEMVPQDYKKAAKWLRIGADRGNEDAQALLGSLYYDGRGVAQSYEEAYFWLLLASVSGKADAVEIRDNVAHRLPPERIAAVQARARDWQPKQ